MATVSAALTGVSNNARSGLNNVLPAPDAAPLSSDTLTSSASSQQFSVTAPSDARGLFWVVTASGNDVWIAFGDNPTAVAGTHYLVVDGTTRDFAAAPSQKIAVIDA